jgi:hypothetical protein
MVGNLDVFDLTDVLTRTKLEREDIPAQFTVAERKVLNLVDQTTSALERNRTNECR